MIMIFTLPRYLMRGVGNLSLLIALVSAIVFASLMESAKSQTPTEGQPLQIRSQTQEANSQTGIFTARGNVQLVYPAREIQATSAQAQYFSRERKIELSGNVYILQRGNSIRGENVTYLIDEGRFVATPKANEQVESIYIIPETNVPAAATAAPATPPLAPQTPAPATPSPGV